MAEYHDELLVAARRLLARRTGQRGPLPTARIRRSISTSYYALFHFILDEVGLRTVGASRNLLSRRMLGRTISHKAVKMTLDKVRGHAVERSVDDFLRLPGTAGPVVSPDFARSFSAIFSDAQSKRHDADYNLNKSFSEGEARLLHRSVARAIERWRLAKSPVDRDFKHALAVLIVLKGQLRAEA